MTEPTDKLVLDPIVRERVTDLLYAHLPSVYRVVDMAEGGREPLRTEAPKGVEELFKFLRVLAAPIAEVRQNVDELWADLFIDKSADWVLPYLADMVGMQLVFPDAPTNRRDVRGTVGWRRRKGTPAMLEEMATELSGQMVTTQEGWKRILLAQDLDLYRPERTVPSLRRASVAERVTGPLDAAFHAVDPRAISRTTGRYHPKHMAHWLHPTRLFPLVEGVPLRRNTVALPPAVDHRFSFHPLGAEVALRVRGTPSDHRATDRVPPMLFAEEPGAFFDQTGEARSRFSVRLVGLPAAVAAPVLEPRAASRIPASAELVAGTCAVKLLEHTAARLSAPVTVEVCAVKLVGPSQDEPSAALFQPRGGVLVEAKGGSAVAGNNTPVGAPYIAMLRLRARGGGGYFPGATIEIAASHPAWGMASTDPRLAERGFLGGALVVAVPATWIQGDRWLFLSADGSVFDAGTPGVHLVSTPDGLRLPGEALAVGPGPAWPPLPLTADPEPWRAMPSALARGPVVVHGAGAVDVSGPSVVAASAGIKMGLVFALRHRESVRTFLRLEWTGPDATSATTWTAFHPQTGAAATTDAELAAALGAVATLADEAAGAAELWIRFESSANHIRLPPCEVACTSDRGEAVLVHLPELAALPPALPAWPPTLDFASRGVVVNADGSTFGAATFQVARYACGPIAPLREAKSLRRRRVRQRTLCWWKNEDPMSPKTALNTAEGALDIDPAHGLFAFAGSEPPPAFTLWKGHVGVTGWPPASVTVDYQDGYSFHTGARPDARESVLNAEQARPTRLVLGGGRLHRGAPSDYHDLPAYPTLKAALDAIATDPKAAPHEIVQIEDSATYEETGLFWPAGAVRSLTLQAAELNRPVIRLRGPWKSAVPPVYEALTLRGLAIEQTTYAGDPPAPTTQAFELPEAGELRVELCTASAPHDLWRFAFATGKDSRVTIFRCVTGKVAVSGKGTLAFVESVVAAAGGRALDAADCEVSVDRSTFIAERADLPADGFAVDARVLEVSESLFTEAAQARDRFHGCVRYSRAEPGSLLPRRHRVTEDRPAFVTLDRTDPAHARLAEACPRSITRGAEDGSEMGAFHGARLVQRRDALERRLIEYTPAGLSTGLLRLD